jgi:disulfide oxidoreductase YuzD
MNRITVVLILTLLTALYVNAETYSWTDSRGVVSFTDDPNVIPRQYRDKAKKSDDITIRNPKVQQDLKDQEERVRQEEQNRPRIILTPDYVPQPIQPPMAEPRKADTDELPPGRTKSQRIRDNIERRETEDKAIQMEEKKY